MVERMFLQCRDCAGFVGVGEGGAANWLPKPLPAELCQRGGTVDPGPPASSKEGASCPLASAVTQLTVGLDDRCLDPKTASPAPRAVTKPSPSHLKQVEQVYNHQRENGQCLHKSVANVASPSPPAS